ncbi:hypothetical protein OROMI_003676 [Orobanche minor]
MSHRIFLPSDHPFQNDTHSFDGNEEHREAPSYPTSSEIFDEVKDLENKFGKLVGDQGFPYNWKKRSIFYELPYWESNLLRHNLDLMHIEKAVCDKLAFTFLGSDKSKDNINARLDLKDKGIRPELHPFVDENGKEWIRASCFELDKKEKLQFCKVLKSVKVPDGYASNISNNVHITEAKLGGPVYYRWMYPPERYLCTLKSYVRNKGRPEGSIAEGYLAEECLSFVSQYLDENVETRQNRTGRNEDRDFMINEGLQIFSKSGHPLWKGEPVVLDKKTLEKAHRYVLFNCEEINEHESIIRRKKRRSQEHDIRRTHSQEFSLWFCSQVLATDNNDSTEAIQNDISFELYYSQDKRVVLFECDWVTKGRRLKQDTDGFTLANFANIKRHDEPFVLASQVQQVKMSKKTISTNSLLQMVKKQRNSFANTVHTKAQLSSDDDYQGDRNMADPVNAQPNHHFGTNQQSAYSGPTNKHVSLGTHQQMSDNIDDAVQDWIDDEVQDWNAFPEENYVAVPRITRSQRTMNNNQRKQSVLVDEQMPPGNFNDAPDVEHDLRDDLFEKSRARGYTYMPHVWAISSKDSNLKRLPIEFNKYGKPIGPNKSLFVEFLGTIVRNGNKAPLNYETWHNMPISFKDDMLEKVKTTYIVPPGYDKLVKQALGRSWKAFKCRIKTAYFDKKLTMEQNLRRRPDMFDERVKDDHWKFLVEHWCKDKTKEMSKKNKENRAMKKMQHIHQITKENERLEKELERKNMIIERLMRNADLRGHPDIVDISSMSPARNSQLEKSAQTLDPASCAHTKSAKTLDPTNSAQTLVPANCARTTVQSFEHDQSSAPTKLFRPPAFAKFTPPTASLQYTKTDQSSAPIRSALTFDTIKSFPRKSPAHTSATSLQLQIGAQVLLRSLLNNDYVAKGVILSLSPSKLVGNEELGAAWFEVKVTVGIKLDEKLIRTIGSVKKIGQVIGRSVAWPKHLELTATR